MSAFKVGRFSMMRPLTAIVVIGMFGLITVDPAWAAAKKKATRAKAKTTVAPTTKVAPFKEYQLRVEGDYSVTFDGDGESGSVSIPSIIVRVTPPYGNVTGFGRARLSGKVVDSLKSRADEPPCQASGNVVPIVSVADFDESNDVAALIPIGKIGFSLVTVSTPGKFVNCSTGTLSFDGLYFVSVLQAAAAQLALVPDGKQVSRTADDQPFGPFFDGKVTYHFQFYLTPA